MKGDSLIFTAQVVPVICFAVAIYILFTHSQAGATDTTAFPVPAEHASWKETDWSAYLAAQSQGVVEYRCPDGSRVDILTSSTAWEVEWSDKWKESIGQAVLYAIQTERTPGVWLLRKPGDDEHYLRCVSVVEHLRGKGLRIELRSQRTY